MINLFIAFIAILLGVGLVIGFHEFGHFVFAKWLGVKVLRFSIGFGKPIWKTIVKGTEYVVGILPLGGYVRLLDEREGEIAIEERDLAFNRQTYWKQILIVFAGPFFNLILAWFAFWLILIVGIDLVIPKIGAIVPGSIAERAGLKPSAQIVQIDNQKVSSWGTVMALLAMKYSTEDKVTVSVISPSNKMPTKYVLNLKNWTIDSLRPSLTKSLGIIAYQPKSKTEDVVYYRLNPLEAFGKAFQQVGFYVRFTLNILWKILTGVLSLQSLSGPISIFMGLFSAFKHGFVSYMMFLAWLSINLAILNLLPIPGLDGSHIVYAIYEGIFKKPISTRVQVLAYRLGLIILLFLMIQVIVNDLLRLLI